MIVSLVKWRKRLKYAILFIALSYVLYLALHIASVWLQPQERYRAPSGGKAVKVIQQEAVQEERLSMKERLLMFYRYGE